jgi:hypothetical protein
LFFQARIAELYLCHFRGSVSCLQTISIDRVLDRCSIDSVSEDTGNTESIFEGIIMKGKKNPPSSLCGDYGGQEVKRQRGKLHEKMTSQVVSSRMWDGGIAMALKCRKPHDEPFGRAQGRLDIGGEDRYPPVIP